MLPGLPSGALLKGKMHSTNPSHSTALAGGSQDEMLLLLFTWPFKGVSVRCHSTRDLTPSPPRPLLLPCPWPGCQAHHSG